MLPVCRPGGKDPLEAARVYYDARRLEDALACAAQAAALEPDDPQTHSERGAALAALDRLDEAGLAYARALAIDPNHLDALLGAAHLFAVALPSTRERDELAAIYAERGLRLAREENDAELLGQFALLSAMANNDLGRASQALERAQLSLTIEKSDTDAQYERAVALFELCRFEDARRAFSQLLDDPSHGAHAHHQMGLLLERAGKPAEAERLFAKARRLSPSEFHPPQPMSREEFEAEVKRAVAALPADMRRDLKGVPVATEELPLDEDLLSGEPPLSPTILGLFRGPPLGERCESDRASKQPCRSVALYRRNLTRAVKTREELIEQIRVTLLHEIGHLRGEDDVELAARGLE